MFSLFVTHLDNLTLPNFEPFHCVSVSWLAHTTFHLSLTSFVNILLQPWQLLSNAVYVYSLFMIASFHREGNKTSLTPHCFIGVLLPSQGSERSCICMFGIYILPLFLRCCDSILKMFRQYIIFCSNILLQLDLAFKLRIVFNPSHPHYYVLGIRITLTIYPLSYKSEIYK